MKTYKGLRTPAGCRVAVLTPGPGTAGGSAYSERPLAPRNDLGNHSPDGFEWGYGGSGPAQLALAILADLLHNDPRAARLHQEFKWDVIAGLPRERWQITAAEIRTAVARIEADRGEDR